MQGSVEAVKTPSLEKLSNDEVRVKVYNGAVGRHQRKRRHAGRRLPNRGHRTAFNVRPDPVAKEKRDRATVWNCA